MQQIASRPQPNLPNNGNPRSPSTLMVGLLVFAMAGLLMGFVVGALNQPKQVAQNTNGGPIGNKPTATAKAIVTTTPPPHIIKLGWPQAISYTYTETADGQTAYTFVMQATDQSNGKGVGKPIHASGITCKIWFIHTMPDPDHVIYKIPDAALQNLADIQNPITGQFTNVDNNQVIDPNVQEIKGLAFDTATTQTQLSNSQGLATWKYTVSPSFPPGTYLIVMLTEWKGMEGTFFNWSWKGASVQKAN